MKVARTSRPDAGVHRHALKAIGVAAALVAAGPSLAVNIDTGLPDLELVLDTTVRYNAAWRTRERDTRLITSGSVDEGNWLFDKGDMILSRLDLFSELDLTYRKNVGLRISASAWGDNNFPSKSVSDPRFQDSPNYPNNDFTPYVKRYYRGPSGEFMDAFAWTNLDFAGTALNLKVGRFAWLPGEFLFSNGGSVSYSMAPNDGRKSDLSPGSSAKETAIPIGQVAATWQLSAEWALMGQYTGEFRSSRISEGGTFWSVGDTSLEGPPFVSNPAVPRGAAFDGKKGDVALGAKWTPAALNGDAFSLWYRKFDDKTPTWQNQVAIGATGRIGRAVYAKDIELLGLTYNTVLGGWGTGVELNYRKKMPLNVRSGFAYGGSPGLVDDPGMEGPRGDTVHFILSSVVTLNKNALFDAGSVAMQFDATQLRKITSGASLYNGVGTGVAGVCPDKLVLRGCSTKNAASIGVSFNATKQQFLPSVDLSVPILVLYGLKGNAAAVGAGTLPERSWIFRPGIRAEYLTGKYKHQFDLAYTARGGRSADGVLPVNPNNPTGAVYSGLANFRDRNYLNFTYQTAF
jgi:hypothetical protein